MFRQIRRSVCLKIEIKFFDDFIPHFVFQNSFYSQFGSKNWLKSFLRNSDRLRHSLWLFAIVNLLFNQKFFTMAEIHVRAKKTSSSSWLWILVSVIVIAVVAFLLWNNRDKIQNNAGSKPTQTSFIQNHSLPAAWNFKKVSTAFTNPEHVVQ